MATRRTFIATLFAALPAWRGAAMRRLLDHPEPREGIDASNVVPASELKRYPDAVPVFDMVREIPQVVDGIRCQCGCGDQPDRYSLLSCFEGKGMARRCEGCKSQVRLIHRLHAEGRTLDDIRAAIDQEFGT